MPDEAALSRRIGRLRRRRRAFRLALRALAGALAAYLAFGVVFALAVVRGDSMAPALRDGDIALFLRLGGGPRAGDIVLVGMPGGAEHVKRVVALPGQTVDVDAATGELVADGQPLAEPYVYEATRAKAGAGLPVTLGEDEYYLLGDHRGNSKDSRNYGPVKAGRLHGRLLLILRRHR